MEKHVVVIASGETERRSIPHLVADLRSEDILVDDVRVPPRNRALDVLMVERLVKASWYERVHDPPHKFVILADTNGKDPDIVLQPFREQLAGRLDPAIQASIQFAYAQQHLEAWYFADVKGLRRYLQRDLGSVDPSKPDEILNPKLHLKHLLGDRTYTAVISEELARELTPRVIAQCSPSFDRFLGAIRNGGGDEDKS